MLFPHTVSIFNRGTNNSSDYYRKTVIENCLWVKDENTARNRYGLTNADSITVYVRAEVPFTKTLVEGIQYPNLPEDEQANCFAFRKGDFIAFGDVGEDGLDINQFKNKTGEIYQITGLATFNFGGIPSYTIAAK